MKIIRLNIKTFFRAGRFQTGNFFPFFLQEKIFFSISGSFRVFNFLLQFDSIPSPTFLIPQTDWVGLLIKLDLEARAEHQVFPLLAVLFSPRRGYLVCPQWWRVSQVNFKIGHHTITLVNIIAAIIIWFLRNSKVLCKCFVSQMEALGLIVIQLNSFTNILLDRTDS